MGCGASSNKVVKTSVVPIEKILNKEEEIMYACSSAAPQRELEFEDEEFDKIVRASEMINEIVNDDFLKEDDGVMKGEAAPVQVDKETKDNQTTEPKEETFDDLNAEPKERKKPYTDEELTDFKSTKLASIKTKCIDALACDPYKNEEGEFKVKIRNAVLNLQKSYFALKLATQKQISEFRKDIADVIIETKFLDMLCEIVDWTYKNGWKDNESKTISTKYIPLSNCLLVLLNFSDASPALAVEMASKPEFLLLMKTIVVDYTDRHLKKAEPALTQSEEKVLRWVMSIIHNMSMVDTNVSPLREAGMIDALQPMLHSETEIVSISSLASLSGIINEKECEIINANKYIVMNLLDMLKKGQTKHDHRHHGWSCKECTFTIRNLARNDGNKKLLVDLGALELLVNLGRNGNEEEQHESVEAIWALSFDEDNQSLITGNAELGVIELLMDLKQSENPKIKKACQGALWTLKDALKKTVVEKYKEIGEELAAKKVPIRKRWKKAATSETEEKQAPESTGGHIMISYQWADQAMLKDIRDNLKACGHKVWMDIDQMGGSTIQAMADAVERADIFLMCMSNKYKNSLPCRSEAEYAYSKKKIIIPLKMEKAYNPDGWLGFILGTKLFYEFSGKYPFEKKMTELLKVIQKVKCELDSVDTDNVIQPSTITVTHSVPPVVQQNTPVSSTPSKPSHSLFVSMETIENVRKWSRDDVKQWRERNNLAGCGVDNITGGEVALLANMRVECPQYFYQCLREMLHINDLLSMSKLVWALNDLSKNN